MCIPNMKTCCGIIGVHKPSLKFCESSNVYFFLPSTTHRSEDINRYFGSVSLSPIDLAESSFEIEDAISYDPSKLHSFCPEKKVINKTVVKMLKK